MNNLLSANGEGTNAKSQQDFEPLAPKQLADDILAKAQRSVEDLGQDSDHVQGTNPR